MAPDPWTAFTFFGLPFAVGLLGLFHGGRLGYRLYVQQSGGQIGTPDAEDGRWRTRATVLRVALLSLGSLVLVIHSGRWLLSIYGYL